VLRPHVHDEALASGVVEFDPSRRSSADHL
jgi:hypothetical protein